MKSEDDSPETLSRLRRRITGNAVWTVVGRVIGIAVSLIINIQMGRKMSPAEYGVWGVLFSIVVTATSVGKFSLPELLTKLIAEGIAHNRFVQMRSVIHRFWLISLISGFLTSLAATGIAFLLIDIHATSSPRTQLAILVGAITFVSVGCSFMGGYFRGIHYASLFALSVPIPSGLIVGPLLIGAINYQLQQNHQLTLQFVLIAWGVAVAFSWLVLESLRLIVPPGKTEVDSMPEQWDESQMATRTILQLGFPLMLSEIFYLILMQADLWLATLFASDVEIGFLTAAKRMGNLVDLPVAMGNLAIASTFAELYSAGKLQDLERLARRTAALLAFLGAGACLVCLLFGDWIMELTYEEAYAGTGHYLAITTCARFAFAFGGPASVILLMTGGGRILLIGYGISVLVMLLASAVLGYYFGMMGLMVASGLGIATSVWIFCYQLQARDGIRSYSPWPWHPDGLRWWLGYLARQLGGK